MMEVAKATLPQGLRQWHKIYIEDILAIFERAYYFDSDERREKAIETVAAMGALIASPSLPVDYLDTVHVIVDKRLDAREDRVYKNIMTAEVALRLHRWRRIFIVSQVN